MLTVVPAILEQEWDAIVEKVNRLKPVTNFVQLDVCDGQFVPNTTFNDTAMLATLDIEMEVHLMIEHPTLHINKWALPNVKRIIVHHEAAGNVAHAIDQIHKAGKEAGIALNPDTSTYDAKEYIDKVDLMVVMGVVPGFSGQEFISDVLEKVKELKRLRPDVMVEVDGGVNGHTRDQIEAAGVDLVGASSYLYNAENLEDAMAQLQNG